MKNSSTYIISSSLIIILLISAIIYIPTIKSTIPLSNKKQKDNNPPNSRDKITKNIEKNNQTEKKSLNSKNIENSEKTILDINNLQNAIDDGKSIMFIQPHSDDSEIFMPGTLALAGGDRGNKCYIVCIKSLEDMLQSFDKAARQDEIQWFEDNYLEEYIFLSGSFPSIDNTVSDEIELQLINIIETIKPDTLSTFSPCGYYGHKEHITTSLIVYNICKKLSYKPSLYYVINNNQDITLKKHYENQLYPPTDIINLDVYSNKLGKTYWETKLEIWEKYSESVPSLKRLLADTERLQNNDRKEYFMKVTI